MKKFSVLIAILSLFVFATAAMAYDDLITDDTAVVKEAGSISARAGLLYLTAGDNFNEKGKKEPIKDDKGKDTNVTHLRIPLKVRYSVIDKLEAFAILPIVSKDVLDWGTGKINSESGIGDIWLGAKYSILEENLLTIRGALDIPTADEDKGLGEGDGFGIDIGALTQKEFEAIKLNGQVGLRYSGEEGDTDYKWKPGIGIYLDGEASYSFTDVLSAQLGLELMFIGEGETGLDAASLAALGMTKDDIEKDSNINWIELNIGAHYSLADNMCIKGDIIFDISGTNTTADMGILIGFNYGF